MKSAKFFKLFMILLSCVFVFACGAKSSKNNSNKQSAHQLTEAETYLYTRPTIYYIPKFNLDDDICKSQITKNLKDKNDATLFIVCDSVYKACLLQGTCSLQQKQQFTMINVGEKKNSEYRFQKVDTSKCPYGYGAGKKICLDPFYSVAADLSIYSLGDVIYIPDLRGLALPDGSQHNGYLIVRDSGDAIKGHGRFDFFTGFISNNKAENPFAKIGLAGLETFFAYYVIQGNEAAQILKSRNYPSTLVKK